MDRQPKGAPMMSQRTNKHQQAGLATIAKRGAHVGATEEIRECLKATDAWLRGLEKVDIAKRTGLPLETVATVVHHGSDGNGIVSLGGLKGHYRYALIHSAAARISSSCAAASSLCTSLASSFEIAFAQPITIPQFRWGAGW